MVYAVWRKVGSKKRDQRLIEMALEMESETAKELEDFKTKVLSIDWIRKDLGEH